MRTESLRTCSDERQVPPRDRKLAARWVEPELLDQLPPNQQSAIESRQDLRRVNWWMGNARILAAAVEDLRPHRIVELGAGDGTLLLQVARRVAPAWTGAEATLLDQQPIVEDSTVKKFSAAGLRPRMETADVFQWLKQAPSNSCDLMVANLFLHHSQEAELPALLHAAARVTSFFVAVEPRRNRWALAACRCLRIIGCNAVTLHDAAISVRAGFRADEVSRRWPAGDWTLREGSAGPFSHLFTAARKR